MTRKSSRKSKDFFSSPFDDDSSFSTSSDGSDDMTWESAVASVSADTDSCSSASSSFSSSGSSSTCTPSISSSVCSPSVYSPSISSYSVSISTPSSASWCSEGCKDGFGCAKGHSYGKHGHSTKLKTCGDLSNTKINSVSHMANQVILNHDQGQCIHDPSKDLNSILQANIAKFGSTVAIPNANANANALSHLNTNTTNTANFANLKGTIPSAMNSVINRQPMANATAALTAAAAAALAPVATAAQSAAAPAAGAAGAAAPVRPAAVNVNATCPTENAGNNCCVLPWIIFIIVAAIAIAVIFAVIFNHNEANRCGRKIDFFGCKRKQACFQQQQLQNGSVKNSAFGAPFTPTPAQQATLNAQANLGSVGQNFMNVGQAVGREIASILQ